MKKFLYKVLLFVSLLAVSLHSIAFYLLWNDRYQDLVAAREVYHVISKSKSKNKGKTVLIGDSVARQIFNNRKHYNTIYSLACNQAISMAGHYFLVNNYLKSGNEIDTLFLFFNPFSFDNNLHQLTTYNYFIKPFYKEEYLPLFTENVNKQVAKIPFHEWSQYPPLLTCNWSPDFSTEGDSGFTFLAPVSIDYLNKIKELAVKHNFELILLPTPVSVEKKPLVEKLNKKEIVDNNFENEFKGYFESILYLEDDNFVDGVHLSDPEAYTFYYKNKFLKSSFASLDSK